MKIHWTRRAVAHLSAIHEYIAKDSPVYATRMVERLINCSEQIARFPKSGRRVPEYDTENIREVIQEPYRVIYRIKPGKIDVLAVVHGSQILPSDL